MIIKIVKKDTAKIKAFEKEEWKLADVEHYGKGHTVKKNFYKFVMDDEKGNILGTLSLVTDFNVAYLDSILVNSKYRKQGVGKKLIEEAEKIAKKNGCNKIWLETDEDWEASKFYKKLNYKITGTHENHYFGKRALIFTKFF